MNEKNLNNVLSTIEARIDKFFQNNNRKRLVDLLIDLDELSIGLADLGQEKEALIKLIYKTNFDIKSSHFVEELDKHYNRFDCHKVFSDNDQLYWIDHIHHYDSIRNFLENNEKINSLVQLLVKDLWLYTTPEEKDFDIALVELLEQEEKENTRKSVIWWMTIYHNVQHHELEEKLRQVKDRPVLNDLMIEKIKNIIQQYLYDNWYDTDWNTKSLSPKNHLIHLLEEDIILPLIESLISIDDYGYSVYDNNTKKELLDNLNDVPKNS